MYITEISKGIGGSLGNSGTPDSNGRYILESKNYITENLTWRILGINENGQIELISENPMSDVNNVCLANEEGYLYSETKDNIKGTLDTMCDRLYGNGIGAESARSLNVKDIDKLAKISTDADKKALQSEYGTKWKYRFPSTSEVTGTRKIQYIKNSGSGYSNNWNNITVNEYVKFRLPGAEPETELNSINTGISPELSFSYYSYSIMEKIDDTAQEGIKIADLISKGTTSTNINQWLASNAICCNSASAYFGLRCIEDGNMRTYGFLFCASGEYGAKYSRIRPVITLNSDIQLEPDETTANTWKIK